MVNKAVMGEEILKQLRRVAAERLRRRNEPALASRVAAVKRFQHQRFEQTYADLLASPRYAKASRFFLDDLYGPDDFTSRDDQFARIVPALVRLFPTEIVGTVQQLAELHALSEVLDSTMANTFGPDDPTMAAYVRAWQATGAPDDRERQIVLATAIGEALDQHTRNPLLRNSLRMMRLPAKAAGLGDLQAFLERGFDAFAHMRGAKEFLGTIAARERQLAAELAQA